MAGISAVIIFGIALIRVPEMPVAELFKSTEWTPPVVTNTDAAEKPTNPKQDLLNRLIADGTETRLGDALKALLEQERGSALSSVIVFTDGRSNSGIDPVAAAVGQRHVHYRSRDWHGL